MPTVRVSLACTSPTKSPLRAYSTLVLVSEDAYAEGAHLRVAATRASLLGYGGPHHVLEARRVDGGPVRAEDLGRSHPAAARRDAPLRDRLLESIPGERDALQPSVTEAVEHRSRMWLERADRPTTGHSTRR